jgi:molybdopterin converting factor small subunit
MVWTVRMEVKVRYLGRVIAKYFGSSEKVETIHVSDGAKYEDLLSIFRKKLRRHGEVDERLLDTFLFVCGGRVLLNIKDESLNSGCEVLVGYADTGG